MSTACRARDLGRPCRERLSPSATVCSISAARCCAATTSTDAPAPLNALGFDAGREDGILGADTRERSCEFQRNAGLARRRHLRPVDRRCAAPARHLAQRARLPRYASARSCDATQDVSTVDGSTSSPPQGSKHSAAPSSTSSTASARSSCSMCPVRRAPWSQPRRTASAPSWSCRYKPARLGSAVARTSSRDGSGPSPGTTSRSR